MDDGPNRAPYEDSIKATDTTRTAMPQPNHNNQTDLFKEDSESSNQDGIQLQPHPQEYAYRPEVELNQLRKFMKKADQLNEVNYRKLQIDRTLVPEGSSLNIYKSNKNILEQIARQGPSARRQKNKQIKQIYLGGRESKRITNPKKMNRTSYLPQKRKVPTATKEVQTETGGTDLNNDLPNNHRLAKQKYPGIGPKRQLNKTLKAIEEDEDEDVIPQRRRHRHRAFNTLSLNSDTIQISRPKANAQHFLQNVSRNQHSFTSSLKRYDFKQDVQAKTVFNVHEPAQKHSSFLKSFVIENPWEDADRGRRRQNRVQLIQPLTDRQGQHSKSLTQNVNNDQSKISNHDPHMDVEKKNEDIGVNPEPVLHQYEKMPEIPKTTKKSLSQHSTIQQAPTENSMMVQQNNSRKNSIPSEYSFSLNKGHTSSNFNQSKNLTPIKYDDERSDRKQGFAQAPEIRQIAIGTDTNNFMLASKKPLHPININFSENDAAWITSHYKPKSQFLTKIDMKHFDIKKYRNGVYFGQISPTGQKEGKGVVFYFNGRSYEGNFSNDLKEGKGYEYLADGSVYKGDFKQGLKEGKGIFEWPNGEVYDGQWANGKKNGSGMWKSPNGDSYLGEWKNGKVEGFGVLVLKEGDRYEGEFKNSMKFGLGTERYSNGDTYVGEFSKNRPNGQGEYYSHNGDYFKGIFSNGLKHGDGTFKSHKGQIFQGQYRNDKRCGFGELKNADGSIYRGNFENDLEHGYGELKREGDIPLSGYWINGKKVEQDMGVIQEDELQRQESLPAARRPRINRQNFEELPKTKKKGVKKTPKASPKKSIEKSLSPEDPNSQRPCGCKRKH